MNLDPIPRVSWVYRHSAFRGKEKAGNPSFMLVCVRVYSIPSVNSCTVALHLFPFYGVQPSPLFPFLPFLGQQDGRTYWKVLC